MTRRADRTALVLVIAFSFFGMLALNAYMPLMMDDYDYSFSWATGERLAGVGDIFASQAAHYRLWGGRSVVHFLAQLFLYLGKPMFNVLNAAMYVLLLLEMAALGAKPGQRCSWRGVLVSHLLMMTCVPFFGTVFLWLDGACNYLWGTALALVPLLIAKSEREGGCFDAGWTRGWAALPMCFLAGWTNENTACGVLAALFLLLVWDRIKGRRVRAWRVAALGMQALGVAVMLLAPGNFARAGEEAARGFVMEMIYRFAVVTYCLVRYAGVPIALAAAALLAVRRRKAAVRGEGLAMLAAAALLSAYALVGSPQISDRSFTAVVVLCIAALLTVMNDLKAKPDRHSLTVGVVLAAIVLGVSIGAVRDVKAHGAAWQAQVDAIEAAAAAGETDVYVSSAPQASRFTMAVSLESEPDAWPNSTIGKYYGVRVHGR